MNDPPSPDPDEFDIKALFEPTSGGSDEDSSSWFSEGFDGFPDEYYRFDSLSDIMEEDPNKWKWYDSDDNTIHGDSSDDDSSDDDRSTDDPDGEEDWEDKESVHRPSDLDSDEPIDSDEDLVYCEDGCGLAWKSSCKRKCQARDSDFDSDEMDQLLDSSTEEEDVDDNNNMD